MKNLLSILLFVLVSQVALAQTERIFITTESGSSPHFPTVIGAQIGQTPFEILQVYTFKKTPVSIWILEVETDDLPSVLLRLEASPKILTAEIDADMWASDMETYDANDLHVGEQWYGENTGANGNENADIDLPEGWFIERGSPNITLAILDSGMKLDHPEFAGRIVNNTADPINNIDDDANGYIDDVSGFDFVDHDNHPGDENGHGTAVGGIAAANGDNIIGFAGVDWNCKILPVRVLDENGRGSYSKIAAGVYYAVDNGANVINMSLGGVSESNSLKNSIQYAYDNNVTVVAASGNSNTSVPQFPAAYPTVIAVGATNWFNERCSPFMLTGRGGSNMGKHLSVVAPGDMIPHLNYEDDLDYSSVNSGTSLASPMVAGLATLLLAQDSTRTAAEIKYLIQASAVDRVGPENEDSRGWDQYYGFGLINVYNALSGKFPIKTESYISVYPNPAYANGKFHLGGEASDLIISTVDGRVIINYKNLSAGIYNLPQMAAGYYVISVVAPTGFYIERFTVL
ncbi:S8 family peptidase [Phaeocystidibacter marisrubri]|uniref:S8 family serine peptidase n=1 Tax=Phaeocystidibacter marisrubri TaxID=1577780 RepID=A0A6L3ZJA3_9FLAO|nr:S8 family peptidase [Phaeocystidibacter marisrubri]KAB2818014.1 S8 family serine peptidase [Phaeocystidibacter marisrubri]GGH72384.1 hypothetical protein GCM10011318_16300 [Phaeocystidibacter marisrubri]